MEDIERVLKTGDPEERRRAVARIADEWHARGAPTQPLVPLLVQALGDEDWRVRKEATSVAIALAPAPEVLAGLVRVLRPSDNVGQRNAAVEAIGGYGIAAVEAVRAVLQELDADGRKLAVEALARCGDISALEVLEEVLQDEDPNVRAAAVEAVAGVGATAVDRAAALLAGRLGSADGFEALAILEGLNRLDVIVDWTRLQRFLDDPMLEHAALAAAGRSQHAGAGEHLVRAIDRLRGSRLTVAVSALATYIRNNPQRFAAIRALLSMLSPATRERLLAHARGELEDREGQQASLLVAGALGTQEAAEAAVSVLGDDPVAAAADEALVMLGRAAIPTLAARAMEGEPHDRSACIELLGRLADDATVHEVRAAIHEATTNGSPEIMSAAFMALERIGDETSLELAVRWLTPDAPAYVRNTAAAALASAARRHPEAARAVARRAAPDVGQAAVTATVIAALGGGVLGGVSDDVEFLILALSNESTLVRKVALDALATLPSASAVDAVSFALTDEAEDVRLAAVRALGRMRGEDGRNIGLEHLLGVIRESSDDMLVTTVIAALGDAGDSSAVGVLRSLAREGAAARAVAAVAALGRLPGPQRLEALIEALDHSEPEVTKAALRGLEGERGSAVEQHIGACLDHPAWDVRRLAADLLGRRGGEGARKLLRARLALEGEPLVKEAIQRSLTDLEGTVRHTISPPGQRSDDEGSGGASE